MSGSHWHWPSGCRFVRHSPTLSNCKDSDTAWKIFGGYEFTPNLALELGYNDFGRISSDATVVVGGSTFTGNAKIEATAFELTGIGSLPLGHQFSLYGKLGVYYAETKSSANVRQTTPPFATGSSSASDNNTNLTFGFGARYDITRNIAVRAEWLGARVLDMPVDWTDQPDSKSSARLINLSLLYLAGIAALRQEKRRLKVSPAGVAR